MQESIEGKLRIWGRWASDKTGTEYRCALEVKLPRGTSLTAQDIDTAMRVDAAIANLNVSRWTSDHSLVWLLKQYYMHQCSYAEIAAFIKAHPKGAQNDGWALGEMSKDKIWKLLCQAKGYVAGWLDAQVKAY
ncbi:hypothetical protein [Paraferrimonas haliotis]|uniref:hypothetical protein n=1 Tax=Paraferrimonas haliotis TaxID=2013866 RepID=UPI000BA96A9D|nr:hypothetical protein [Paraferrimonas haliotis]